MKVRDKIRILEDLEAIEKIPHGDSLIIVKLLDGSYQLKGKKINEKQLHEIEKWNHVILMKPSYVEN